MVKSCTEENVKSDTQVTPNCKPRRPLSVTINEKTNPKTSTETSLSTTNTAAPTPAQEEVQQKKNTKNDILVDLCKKRDQQLKR